ncbi:hypothetical protein [Pseudoruegeria sp. HB172150]|uniref:hypothetical protein n=1 Tax=Pseudoruegeria sp. HB172150 TaxID=2721164 RepID=UPI001554A9F9|nr:hypothetical protein [Pseudoruegeria sp. HB172150]
MFAAFADLFAAQPEPQATTAPQPKRRSGPLLMTDILIAPGGEPEFVTRWREDRDHAGDAWFKS